jgi:hypothetical protein
MSDLIDRLRGVYRIPINDGLGPVATSEEPYNANEFVRSFPTVPIQIEAADALQAALDRADRAEAERDAAHNEALEKVLAIIAALPTPENEDIMRGHEDAYRAVEQIKKGTPNAEAWNTRALSAAERVKPQVKPLEWKKGSSTETASTPVGAYSVWCDDGEVFVRQPRLYHGSPFDGTIEEAKAMLGEHYERSILLALQEGSDGVQIPGHG